MDSYELISTEFEEAKMNEMLERIKVFLCKQERMNGRLVRKDKPP